MKESKLTQLLRTFSETEWKEFEKFAASPYFNGGRNYIPVLKYFKKIINGKGKLDPDPEEIYKKLYPGKQFNKSVINTVLSGFTRLAEEYLSVVDYETNQFIQKNGLHNQLLKRNCDDYFKRETSLDTKKAEESLFDLDVLYFKKDMQENIIRLKYKTNFDKSIENEVKKRSDYRFFISYLWFLNENRDLNIMKNILNIPITEKQSDILLKYINSEDVITYIEKNYPELANTVGLIILCYTSKDYIKVRDSFFANYQLFNPYLALNLAYVIEGIIVDLINFEHKELTGERHKLHRFMLEKKLLINERTTTLNTRVTENFIYIAFWAGEYDWIEGFLNDYKVYFAEEMRDNLINYANACIFFGKEKYREALKLINLVSDTLVTMKLRMKDMELQILYELGEIEQIFFAIDNYIKFKKNPLISEWNKEIMDSNINAYKLLVNIKEGKKQEDTGLTIKKLKSTMPSQFSDWLIKKFSEIDN